MALQERIDRLDMVVKGFDAILLAIHDEPDVIYCRKELVTFKNFFAQRLTSLKTTQTFVEKHELSTNKPEVGYSNSSISTSPKCARLCQENEDPENKEYIKKLQEEMAK